MRIRFMGLICHIDRARTGNHDIAVLVKAAAHLPRLRIPKRHIVGETETDTRCFALNNHSIQFSLGAGVANRAGLTGVPRLMDMGATANSILHPRVPVKDATDINDSLESFVTLPAGTYGIEDHFYYKGILPGGTVCVPRTVIYNVTVPAGTTQIDLLGLPGGMVPLRPTAVITITNLEPAPSNVPHFKEYGKIFLPAEAIVEPQRTNPPERCLLPTATEDYAYPSCGKDDFKNIGVECTNSTYP